MCDTLVCFHYAVKLARRTKIDRTFLRHSEVRGFYWAFCTIQPSDVFFTGNHARGGGGNTAPPNRGERGKQPPKNEGESSVTRKGEEVRTSTPKKGRATAPPSSASPFLPPPSQRRKGNTAPAQKGEGKGRTTPKEEEEGPPFK